MIFHSYVSLPEGNNAHHQPKKHLPAPRHLTFEVSALGFPTPASMSRSRAAWIRHVLRHVKNVENGDILSGIYHRLYHDVAFPIEFTIEFTIQCFPNTIS